MDIKEFIFLWGYLFQLVILTSIKHLKILKDVIDILQFEKLQNKGSYTTVLGSTLNIEWKFTLNLKSKINYLELLLSKDTENVLIANLIVGEKIHITNEMSPYVSKISYTSIDLKNIPLSFDQSTIYIKVHFHDEIDNKHYQKEYSSLPLSVLGK